MPFREKLRKTFSRGSSSATGSDASNTPGDDTRTKPNPMFVMYKPGEKIPYKYRRPVDQAHKEALEAFSFDNAWKRCSYGSQYSPMGSKMPSRRNSVDRQMGRRSLHMRRGDVGELSDGDSAASSPSDADSQVGPFSVSDNSSYLSSSLTSNSATSRNNNPFTPEDLSLALQRSRLEIPP